MKYLFQVQVLPNVFFLLSIMSIQKNPAAQGMTPPESQLIEQKITNIGLFDAPFNIATSGLD
jgi:hypothetical protein